MYTLTVTASEWADDTQRAESRRYAAQKAHERVERHVEILDEGGIVLDAFDVVLVPCGCGGACVLCDDAGMIPEPRM